MKRGFNRTDTPRTNAKCECYGCVNRTATCHGECESYLAYRRECDNIRDNRLAEQRRVDLISGYEMDKAKRLKIGQKGDTYSKLVAW